LEFVKRVVGKDFMVHHKILTAVCISAILLCSSCASVSTSPKTDSVTAILGAFDEEVVMLQQRLTGRFAQKAGGMEFASGRLSGRKVVIARTGIGKVNAAMTTTLLLEHFKPTEVIFTGIAGGINPELDPGDIVIAEKTAQHDLGILTNTGIENRGEINPFTQKRNPVFFEADKRLLSLARQAAKRVELETITQAARKPKIIEGTVVTGDVFVSSAEKCAELAERLGADAVEMEGAAVAQICFQKTIPCIIIRSISDKADLKAMEDLEKFYETAAENSARLTVEIVKLLAQQPQDNRSLRE